MTQPIQQPNSTNININLSAMSAVLPCKPGEGQEINQFVAVLRGCHWQAQQKLGQQKKPAEGMQIF